jgi:putative nucleotidyltransferase with HDIG domain
VVVENARLFAIHSEEIRRLEALTSASSVVNSTLDLKPLLKLVMELAARTLRAEASAILLKDKASGDLLFDTATGEAADRVRTIRVPRGQGIAGHVAETGESLLVPDCSQDPRFFKAADEKSKFVTRNIIAVPLVARGETIGVVEVLNRLGGGTFTPEDMALLQALAHQSAVAIQNAQLFQDVQDSFLATVKALAQAVDAKDSYTAGHSSRVTLYSTIIAEELGLSEAEVRKVRLAGLLHDVGKIGIRDSVLGKPGHLTDEEFGIMKSHPAVGAGILRPVVQLADVIPGVLSHHERYDGKGYPQGLQGEAIPLLGRIIGVADAFDAMTSDRVYRPRLSDEVAIAELKKHSGTQFDSRVVKAFFSAYDNGLIVTEPGKLKNG